MKRLLFFPGHRLIAYEWEGGACRRQVAFEPDEAGYAAFAAWLAESPRVPIHLLLDVIEEEFHIERVPHVIGWDRAELYQRAAEKRFRSTPYRYITRQRRLADGRRDDELLVAGLTNPDLMSAWLEVIDEAGAPLRGIHSLPLVGQSLVRRLGFHRGRTLLVSQEVASTVRQSYYDDGQLRFSRLVPGRYEDQPGYADFLDHEIEQTIHFLGSQRFRRQDEPLNVVVLVDDDDAPAVRERLADSAAADFHVLALSVVAARVGLHGALPHAHADVIFGHTLLRERLPANHYGLAHLRRHYFVQRGRLALGVLALALVLAAGAVAGGAFVRVEAREAAAAEARERARVFEQRYEGRLRQLAEFDYRAVDVKEAVDLFDDLEFAARITPEHAMAHVGDLLAGHPNILLQSLDWHATRDPGDDVAGAGAGGQARPVLATGNGGSEVLDQVRIRGDVIGFGGVYRTAVEHFNDFTADLRASALLDEVVVVQAPFDLEPDTGVSGDTGTGNRDQQAQRAGFTIVVRMRGGDHAAR